MRLLAEIDEQTADAPAVDFEGALVTYDVLRSRAAALAAEIRRRGEDGGGRVALLLPHGAWEPSALLAVWAAGAVAVPLDLHWPIERIREILSRCDAGMLVATGQRGASLASALGEPWSERTLLIDAPVGWSGPRYEALAEDDRPLAASGARTDDVASILFTSGSTGSSKGVTLTRANVDVFAVHWAGELGLARGDRVAHASDLAFDLSLLEIGATLAGGGTVVPVPEAQLGFPAELASWVIRREVSVWYSVPSLLVGMVRGGLAEAEPGHRLRVLLYAGERMGGFEALMVRQAFPRVRFLNLFGPTETNVSCAYEIPATFDGGEVPIGWPCPYVDLRLVDDSDREADEGEIVVAGGTVMAGYWAESRREQWLEIEARPYLRTGDRARRGPGGELQFLGRLDRMVKVSGYRIEPEEVEAALLAVGGVGDAAVVAVHDAREHPVLAAVVSPTAGRPFDVEGTGRALSLRLPAYAVPRLFVTTAEMPRTSRGKVDGARVRLLAQGELDRLAEAAAGGPPSLTDPENER